MFPVGVLAPPRIPCWSGFSDEEEDGCVEFVSSVFVLASLSLGTIGLASTELDVEGDLPSPAPVSVDAALSRSVFFGLPDPFLFSACLLLLATR